MNFSRVFIRRPIGTTLLAIGLFLVGVAAYIQLPVASLPNVEFPTIVITANRPGAAPEVMAATVAAPLERQLGTIAGVADLSSVNSLGNTRIRVEFDLSRNIDGAARDVQAALNAALTDLPGDMPTLPRFRKVNPSARPILILALTSNNILGRQLYDAADSVIAQRLSQVEGVADVTVAGSEQPAIRVRVDPSRLAAMGVSMEQVRTAIANSNAVGPLGTFDGSERATTIGINNQLKDARQYDPVVVKTVDGTVIRLSNIATIRESVRNSRSAGWFNRKPSVLLIITKQGDANVIETVDRIYKVLPEIRKWVPAGVDISVLSDRTQTIYASVEHMQITLTASIVLVMLVVALFLRRTAATLAAGVTVPLSLCGTFAAMWLVGFSIDNLSLMALAVCIGFVVDDAIVMIENVFRNLEKGYSPLRAALIGSRQIGFTVISISVSLIAAFIPLLFMGDVVGRLFREFSVTLAFAIAVSTMVSLSVTPMICAYFVRERPGTDATWLDRLVEGAMRLILRFYDRSLTAALNFRILTLIVFLATIALTIGLYIKVPKGYLPRDDSGLIYGGTRASTDISFDAMKKLQMQAMNIILTDPAVEGLGSSIGTSSWNASVNRGRMFISLKPLKERGVSTQQVVARLRAKVSRIPGLRVFMAPAQALRRGHSDDSEYELTLWSADIKALDEWVPKVVERLQELPGLTDVNTDRDQGGLQATVEIDRKAASRLGVRMQDIDSALNNAFSQRQVSTIYGSRNQYRVVLEVENKYKRDPTDITHIYVTGSNGRQVPLSSVAQVKRTISPLVVNHEGQFPSITINYSLKPGVELGPATAMIEEAVAEMHLPDSIRSNFSGDAQSFKKSAGAQPLLILAALIAVYIVLGVLYESLVHPLTIISTLPSAGLGALLALMATGQELTVIAFIGIILLIGIVKKNGIILVDFALDAERQRGLSPAKAIHEACLERFRPILMTTLAAALGAVPLIIATGPGAEIRRPLGITIVGGLLVSQVLTLYTTPVIYLLLDGLHRRLGGAMPTFVRRRPGAPPIAEPAE